MKHSHTFKLKKKKKPRLLGLLECGRLSSLERIDIVVYFINSDVMRLVYDVNSSIRELPLN